MAKHGYAYQKSEENTVKAVGRNLNISPKQGTEICKFIRGRTLKQAYTLLQQAIDERVAIPFTRFTNGLGHKPGMSAGRFHPKACILIRNVIKSAEANAKNKGFNSSDLKIVHLSMQIGPMNQHHGRQKRSIFKNSHIEVVLKEVKDVSAKRTEKKSVKKHEEKTETKIEHTTAEHHTEKSSKKKVLKDN